MSGAPGHHRTQRPRPGQPQGPIRLGHWPESRHMAIADDRQEILILGVPFTEMLNALTRLSSRRVVSRAISGPTGLSLRMVRTSRGIFTWLKHPQSRLSCRSMPRPGPSSTLRRSSRLT